MRAASGGDKNGATCGINDGYLVSMRFTTAGHAGEITGLAGASVRAYSRTAFRRAAVHASMRRTPPKPRVLSSVNICAGASPGPYCTRHAAGTSSVASGDGFKGWLAPAMASAPVGQAATQAVQSTHR